MGIKTELTLTEVQKLFPSFALTQLIPTEDGIMDTTYIAKSVTEEYIVKKYERDIEEKIEFDKRLLEYLSSKGITTSKVLAQNDQWYLYTKLQGTTPKRGSLHHLQLLGRFVAKMHKETKNFQSQTLFLQNYPLQDLLHKEKQKEFYYYKKLSPLLNEKESVDGFIHGDIFTDNTLFYKNSVSLFDFIDGGDGNFAFELGVILISFNPSLRKSFSQILLQSYNQHAPRKITLDELYKNIKKAAQLYTLLRLMEQQNRKKAKELAKLC